MTTRVILDTDFGTVVDDCLALALVLGSPELRLEGVTCVYGDVALRGRMVAKLLLLAGRDDVPVLLGAGRPLLGLRPIHWPGHEGIGLLEPNDDLPPPAPEHAVDFLVRTIMANPGQIHLLAIGPLTNVALAFARELRLAGQLRHPRSWPAPSAASTASTSPSQSTTSPAPPRRPVSSSLPALPPPSSCST